MGLQQMPKFKKGDTVVYVRAGPIDCDSNFDEGSGITLSEELIVENYDSGNNSDDSVRLTKRDGYTTFWMHPDRFILV